MIKVKGIKELQKSLVGLSDQYPHSLFQKINVKGAEPLVSRMHRLAPVGLTGNLADSIGIIKVSKKNDSLGGVQVGPRRGGGYYGYHAHFVEFGTKQRKTKSTGANRGVMPKHPFVSPSWEQTNPEVYGIIFKQLQTHTNKYWRQTVPK